MMNQLSVRDATHDDIEALNILKPASGLHRDRLRDASKKLVRYFVLEREKSVIGFCVLVLKRPPSWSDSTYAEYLPQIVDLQIAPALRSRGYGAFLLYQIAQMIQKAGGKQLFAAVDPVENPRAHAFLKRLGYRALKSEPSWIHWRFTDLEGRFHEGREWTQHLVLDFARAFPDRVSVQLRLDDLIAGQRSREEIAAWAYEFVCGDFDDVEIVQQKAWEMLMDLSLADEQDEPGHFLYDVEDFKSWARKLK